MTALPNVAEMPINVGTFDNGLEGDVADLYTATTPAEGIDGFAAVTDEHIDFFHAHGYLVVHNAFNADEVAASLAGLVRLIDGQVPGFRGIQFEAKVRDILPTLTPDQKQDVVRKLMYFVDY